MYQVKKVRRLQALSKSQTYIETSIERIGFIRACRIEVCENAGADPAFDKGGVRIKARRRQ